MNLSEDIRLKATNLIDAGINPIICVGETLKKKNLSKTRDILYDQVTKSLPENTSVTTNIIIAYEPMYGQLEQDLPLL